MARIHSGDFKPTPPTIMLVSKDEGETIIGIGLRSHMNRDDVDEAVPTACVVAGVERADVYVNGSTCRTMSGNVLGVVGVSFEPPISLDSAAAFAGALTASVQLTGLEVLHLEERASVVVMNIPILA